MENESDKAGNTVTNQSFTHFDNSGHPRMVDVSEKENTVRVAIAEAVVLMDRNTRRLIEEKGMKKGDVLAVAELAGIMGAKRTSDLIPLCHPLALTKVNVTCRFADEDLNQQPAGAKAELYIQATVGLTGKTGVEMEALTACTTAALTVYDMCKAVDKRMEIQRVRLIHKSGGKSGTFEADKDK